MHSIEILANSGVIHVRILGFLTASDVDAVMGSVRKAVGTVKLSGLPHKLLYDYSGAPVQAQETVAATQELARANPLRTSRTAIVYGSRLAKRQAERIADHGGHVAVFDDHNAALAWLIPPA